MLLDTAFLIDLMHGDANAVERARGLESDLVQQRISSMTIFELAYGIGHETEAAQERERVERVLGSKPVHPADAAVMRKAGRMAGEGDAVGDGDAVIAATARIHEEPVLTRNVDEFERLGVEVATY